MPTLATNGGAPVPSKIEALRITTSKLVVIARCLLFDSHDEGSVGERISGEYRVAFGFGSAGDIAKAARIIEPQFEHLADAHLLEADLGMGPVQGAFDASKIEPDGGFGRHLVGE
jgi:hypothetical protein